MFFLSAIEWNPDPVIFYLPYLNLPVTWYGFLFASGIFISYFLIRRQMATLLNLNKEESTLLTDQFTFYVVLGTVIGARLGHVIFYEPQIFLDNPIDVFKTWEGGLASHGGIAGIACALFCFYRKTRTVYPLITFRRLLDMIAPPAVLVGVFIRIGNFINQEVLGKGTDLFWGIRFLSPRDGSFPIIRHPAQLYEALFYLFMFFLLRKKAPHLASGKTAALCFGMVFTFRFFVEFLKIAQSEHIETTSFLLMGQYLSIPIAMIGWVEYFRKKIRTPLSRAACPKPTKWASKL